MTGLLDRIVNSFWPDKRRTGPRAFLGAFGKHPGWGDHTPPIGVEDRLADVMECLYLAGVERSCIAFWQGQDPQQLFPMGHLFVWNFRGSVVVGRLWQSRDASNPPRREYPMVLAAQYDAVPLHHALDWAMPRLAALEGECRSTDDPGRVQALVEAARQAVRGDLESAPPEAAPLPVDALPALIASPAMTDVPERIGRVLHVLDGANPNAPQGASGIPLRVPRCAPGERMEVLMWRALIEELFGPQTPSLILLPLAQEWSDIVVGRPDPAHFRRLRMTPALTPLTTEVPYSVLPAVRERARRLAGFHAVGGRAGI